VTDQPLGKVFETLHERLGCNWKQVAGIHLLRDDNWDQVESADLPAPLLRKRIQYWAKRSEMTDEPLKLEELAALISDLNGDQIGELRNYIYPVTQLTNGDAGLVYLYGAFSEADRKKFESDDGYSLDKLSKKLRDGFIDTFRKPLQKGRAASFSKPGVKIRLRKTGEKSVKFQEYDYNQWLPLYQPIDLTFATWKRSHFDFGD
jgi:hypothetical protein